MDTGLNRGTSRRDYRRIGRKMLSSGRTLALLEARNPAPKTRKWHYTFKRWHAVVPVVIAIIVAGAFGGQAWLHAQQAAKEKAAFDAANAHARSVSKKAEECRQSKVQQNAAVVSTMTYDQLYGDSCNY